MTHIEEKRRQLLLNNAKEGIRVCMRFAITMAIASFLSTCVASASKLGEGSYVTIGFIIAAIAILGFVLSLFMQKYFENEELKYLDEDEVETSFNRMELENLHDHPGM